MPFGDLFSNGIMVLGTLDAIAAFVLFFLIGTDSAGDLKSSPELYGFLVTEFLGLLLLSFLCVKWAWPLWEGQMDFKKPDTYFVGLFFISFYAHQFVNICRTDLVTFGVTLEHVFVIATAVLRLTLTVPLTKCLLTNKPAGEDFYEKMFMITMLLNELLRNVGAQLRYPVLAHGMTRALGKDILFLAITKPCTVVYLFRCILHVLGHSEHHHAAGAAAPLLPVAAHPAPAVPVEEGAIAPLLPHAGAPLPTVNLLTNPFVIACGLMGFAIMYGADVLDRALVDTGCAYEVGRISLCILCLLAVWPLYARNSRELSWVKILLFLGQLGASVGTLVFLASTPAHHDHFSCEDKTALIATEVASLAFAFMQFWVVFCNTPTPSRSRAFLSFVSLGMVWFDFSDEAQHLLHWDAMADEADSSEKWSFMWVQFVFWMGVEFKVLVFETLLE